MSASSMATRGQTPLGRRLGTPAQRSPVESYRRRQLFADAAIAASRVGS
jgi:hypothetical protein